MILKFVDKGKAIELVAKGEKGADFDEMVAGLPDKEPVLVLFDFNFEFEQREGIFDVLNISELRTLHSRWKNIILTFLNRKIEPYNIIAVDE